MNFQSLAPAVESTPQACLSVQKIAIYDVDRTLTRLPTYTPFLFHAMMWRAPWRGFLIPLLLPVACAHKFGIISRRQMKQFMHWIALGKHVHRKEADTLAARFAEKLFFSGLYKKSIEQIERDRSEGFLQILATAAPHFYIEPLARRLKIEDVVATGSSWSNGKLTPIIDGENCYGSEKLSRIVDFFNRRGFDRERLFIRFYTDHQSDLPLCQWVDEPVAVNPSSKMRQLAVNHGWRIEDWRLP